MLLPDSDLDKAVMIYAKGADGVGCERGSFLYDEIARGLTALQDAGYRICPPGHMLFPTCRQEAELMNCFSERFLKDGSFGDAQKT